MRLLLLLQLLALLLDLGLQLLVLLGPVDEHPGDPLQGAVRLRLGESSAHLSQERRADGDEEDEERIRPHPRRPLSETEQDVETSEQFWTFVK